MPVARTFDIPTLVGGVREAQARLETSISRLTDDEVRQPSLLPDWTRGHVLTHIARNAEGGTRMLEAALAGRVGEQYPGGAEGRNAEIEAGAQRTAAELISDVQATASVLNDMFGLMTDEAWGRPVRFLALGEQPAARVVWTRWREVEIHHCDLDIGYGPADWPEQFIDQYLSGELRRLADRLPPGLAVDLQVPGYEGWYGPDTAKPLVLTGTPWGAYAWLVGRNSLARKGLSATYDGEPSDLIQLPMWA